MRQAQQQRLADNQTNGFFTPKAVETIGRKLKNGRIYGVVGGGDFFFDLADPVSERVRRVTGITDGPDQSTKIVEFETIYDLPKELELIREHIYTGQALKRNVKKYDDGWRVENARK